MAVDATGTPTSPDSIPTYNTANDNPSGKGLNNIVAAIQTALSGRVTKPAGIATSEVPVWSGSTFVRSTATRIGADSLPLYAAYTPTWTASGTAPSLGNGLLTGRYAQFGKLVHCYGNLSPGSTTTFGTGSYEFALPVAQGVSNNETFMAGGAEARIGATGNFWYGYVQLPTSTTCGFRNLATPPLGALTLVGQLIPVTWASGDRLNWSFIYEAA